MAATPADLPVDSAIINLLGHRFGDGLVYLRDAAERPVFRRAVRLGLLDAEGYVTPAGRSVSDRHPTG